MRSTAKLSHNQVHMLNAWCGRGRRLSAARWGAGHAGHVCWVKRYAGLWYKERGRAVVAHVWLVGGNQCHLKAVKLAGHAVRLRERLPTMCQHRQWPF